MTSKIKKYSFNYKVGLDDGKKFASARNMEFFTSSSSNGENVTEIFDKLMMKVIERFDEYRSVYLK